MADVTGGTPPVGSTEFDVPTHLKEMYDHFGGAGMFAVANPSLLPSSGNWAGRMLLAQSTGIVYVWYPTGWRIVGGDTPSGGRSRVTSTPVASGSSFIVATLDTDYSLSGGMVASGNGIQVPLSGWYQVSGRSTWAANGTGVRGIRVLQNGVSLGIGLSVNAVAGTQTTVTTAELVPLQAGDVLTVDRYQTSGGSLNEDFASVRAAWVRP